MKSWLMLLVIVIMSSFAYAGDLHYLDFGNGKAKIITMAERDMAKFDFPVRDYYEPYIKAGKENVEFEENPKEIGFMLRETRERLNISFADVTVFIEDAETPQYTTLSRGSMLVLDFDRDMVNDVEIRVLGFDKNSDNVTFEFVLSDKSNANYRPTHYISRDGGKDGGKIVENKSNALGYIRNLINKAYDNWEISIGAVIILLLFVWNKRPIEKYIRRTF